MSSPPLHVESLLEALGAEDGYREAVIGDLAEEFQARAAHEGVRVARRWYYREAMRAVPALLRSWGRCVRARDIAHLAGLALTAFVLSRLVIGLLMAMAYGALTSAGVWTDGSGFGGAMWIFVGLKWSLGLASMVLAGFMAAWLHERAPLAGAFALGVVWALVTLIVSGVVLALGLLPARAAIVTTLLQLAGVTVLILGTTLGGVLRVVTTRSARGRRVGRAAG